MHLYFKITDSSSLCVEKRIIEESLPGPRDTGNWPGIRPDSAMQASLPPMHQFAKPARNKLHASHRDRSSSTAPSEQHQISHHREASVHNLGLFARLSSFSTHGNHSGGSRRIEASSPGVSGHTRRPSRDGLDWYCRGSKYSPKDEMLEVSFPSVATTADQAERLAWRAGSPYS